jgi:uncharacterized protein DUF3352
MDGDPTSAPQPDPPMGQWSGGPAIGPQGPSWFSRYRMLLIPGAGILALLAVSAGAVLLLAKPNPTIEKMVPATADVIAIANIDPSMTQKVNLLRAVHSFPDTKTDQAISAKLDEAFKDSGVSFTGDIQPWLGAEIGFSASADFSSKGDSPAAFYAASRDDQKAQALLAKLRASTYGKKFAWKDETYNGFTISVGTPTNSSDKVTAYAYVDHVVVIATSSAVIHEIIDTDQGRAARLVDSSDYKATLAGLPSDRVGFVYINGHSLVSNIKKQVATTPALTPALKNAADVDALQGIAATLSAGGAGLQADLLIKFDQAKLTPTTRQALAHSGNTDVLLRWIPKGSDAFLAITSLNRTITTLLDQAGSDPSVKAETDAFGLTGPSGVLPHMTGDAGLEVEFGANGLPGGAILLGTDNAKSMSTFFGELFALAQGVTSSGLGSSSGSGLGIAPTPGVGASMPAGSIATTTYRGVTITSWSSPELAQLGGVLSPSYAVLDGMGILASTAAEVKAIIDAHKDGATISTDATYKTMSAASLSKPSAVIYLDLAKLLQAIKQSPLASQVGSGLGTRTQANLEPLKAFILTSTSTADQAVERFFVLIQ